MSSKRFLYLDNVSSTKTNTEVLDTYKKLVDKYYANSSAIHSLGVKVKNLEEKSKQQILDLLNINNYRLIFTSGATEANNIAIKSVALKYAYRGKHLITSEIEHPSVYNSFKFLEDYLGFEVTYLKVDKSGMIDLNELKSSLRSDTILVSIMLVNNEIGNIIDPQIWTKIVKENSKALCHCDMVQGIGKIDLDFNNIDLASFSAHKIHGVNGSGFLIMRDHLEVLPLISGGPQQDGFRAGTLNSPANIVLSKTVRLCLESQKENNHKLEILNKYLYSELSKINEVSLNSKQENSVYNIINFSVLGIDSEVLMNALSSSNIFVSAGSTCQSDLDKQSRVLNAINKDSVIQKSRIRIGLDSSHSLDDMHYFIDTLKEIIEKYAI